MKKITFLLLLLIGYGQTYSQDCNDGDCQNIPVFANESGWSPSHGSPNADPEHDDAVVMWSMVYENSNIGLEGEGLNYSGFSFEKGRTYCISYTLESEIPRGETIPVNISPLMNVMLTINPLKGNTPTVGGGDTPPIPESNLEIMSSNIWDQAPNIETHQKIITADNDYKNIWFYPEIKGIKSIQVNAFLHDLIICDITCEDNQDVSFFFQDENGNKKDNFDLCENVTLNAIANTQAFPLSVEISKVDANNTLTVLSKRENSDKLFDLTDFFVNTPTNPVTFEGDTTYEVKIALDRGICGIAYSIERFTYRSGSISSVFELTYDCHDKIFDATTIASSDDSNQYWKLYEVRIEGSTSDADTIGLVAENQGNSSTYTFKDLDPKKYYYIAHNVSTTTNCSAEETRISLTPDCCPSNPQIFAYCEDPCALDSFPLKVKDENGNILTGLSGYSFVWTNASNGETSTNDIVIATSSDIWILKLTRPDYVCEYELNYSVSCCDDDITLQTYECPSSRDIEALTSQFNTLKSSNTNSEYQKHIKHTKSFEKTRSIGEECNPCEDGLFIIKVIDNSGNLVTDFNSITWSDGLYANQNIRWGTVDTEYTATIITDSSNGVDFCTYEDAILYECEGPDECDNLVAPNNLRVRGTTLSWDPVPGAVSYIVNPASQQGDLSCCLDNSILFNPFEVDTNTLQLPRRLAINCFAWEVVAVCGDQSTSAPSASLCYIPEIDETPTCNLPAPTNLISNGYSLRWTDVAGATGYVVRPANSFCCFDNQTLLFENLVTNNSFRLSTNLQRSCFAWEVAAICSNGEISTLSNSSCHFGGNGDIGWELRTTEDTKEDVSIFPNPNNGEMNIKVNSDSSLKIFRLNGTLIKSIQKINSVGSVFNLQSNLPKGVYIFQFNTKTGTTSKQVIIK